MMKKKQIVANVIIFSVLVALLSSVFNFESSEASSGYVDVYPTLSQSQKDELSTAMFWLHRVGEFQYKDKYKEDLIVFTAMEQAIAGFYNKNIEYYGDLWDTPDPLRAFEGQSYDKVEGNGVDWYLTNFWNIKPSHFTFTEDRESYYHKGYYYKYYHNFPIMSEPKVKKLYDLGKDYYCVEYEVAYDYDWDEYFGPYYAILNKKDVQGQSIWSCIYNQNLEDSLSLEKVLSNIEPEVATTQEELDHYVAQINTKPKIKINYSDITMFEDSVDFIGYLKKAIEDMNGLPLNDMDKSEIATYIENGITITSKNRIGAKNNRITIEAKDMVNSIKLAKETISKFESILSDEKISLNKELEIIIRIDGTNIVDNQPLQITLKEGILEDIKNIDTLMILLGENNRGIKITTDNLKQIIGEYGTINIQIETIGKGEYNITFADQNDEIIEKLPTSIGFFVPAESHLATIFASHKEGNHNWGGQYDGVNGSIEFSTRYSGKYEVLENDISIKDIEELSDTQKEAIRFMVSKGYFELQGDLFSPKERLTRYDFAESLVRMFFALEQDIETSFTDVPRDSKYYASVASAEKDSIVQGFNDKTFRGDMQISKEQVIALCARTLIERKGYTYPEYPENYLDFTDLDEIGDWARMDIALAVREGLINGTGSLNPKENINRAESAEMLYNLFMLLYETAPAEFVMLETENIVEEVEAPEGIMKNKALPLIMTIIICSAVAVGVGIYFKKR